MGLRWFLRGNKFYLVGVFGSVINRVPLYVFFFKKKSGKKPEHRFVLEVELFFLLYLEGKLWQMRCLNKVMRLIFYTFFFLLN